MVNRPIEISRAIESGEAKNGPVERLSLILFIAAVFAAAAAWPGCSFTEVHEEEAVVDPVVLIDQTGKEWDITTAVHKYGFEVDRFEFGLGPRAIRPLIEPDMILPGEFGYPSDDAPFLVIGSAIDGDIRAYGKLDLTANEVVDDYIGGAPVAVAY